jgi:hypothetical protein
VPQIVPGIRTDSTGPAIDKVWSRVRKAVGLNDVRLHVRRQFAADRGSAQRIISELFSPGPSGIDLLAGTINH